MNTSPRPPSPLPPPPMPSPQVVPSGLPAPPVLPRRRSSRNRLQLPSHPAEPPIPPRLIGSPLLQRITGSPQSQPSYFSPQAQSELWLDGDEFGIGRKENAHLQDLALPPPASPMITASTSKRKRSLAHSGSTRRSPSPPPTPRYTSPPPPVPPLPPSAFASPGSKRSAVRSTSNKSSSHLAIPELVLSSGTHASDYSRGCSPAAHGVTCLEFITRHNINSSQRVAT